MNYWLAIAFLEAIHSLPTRPYYEHDKQNTNGLSSASHGCLLYNGETGGAITTFSESTSSDWFAVAGSNIN